MEWKELDGVLRVRFIPSGDEFGPKEPICRTAGVQFLLEGPKEIILLLPGQLAGIQHGDYTS